MGFSPDNFKNFKEETWTVYGKQFKHLMIDIDDVDDTNLLIELAAAVRFIDEGLKGTDGKPGGVFVHCAAGKSRSVSTVIAYLLWKHPQEFNPDPLGKRSRKEAAVEAVAKALALIRTTRPMGDPNDGFMEQLALWWEMGCPEDVEKQPIYQRWVYKREVAEDLAVGQAPSRLRFEDEETPQAAAAGGGSSLRCKKCRRVLATAPFVINHQPAAGAPACQHQFIEPLSWMRSELEKGELNGRLLCPNTRCGAAVGRYDWKGFKCSCGGWLTPAFSLQKARVDEEVGVPATARSLGIRMPPGMGRGGNL